MKEPEVHVGILFEPVIELVLLAPYCVNGEEVTGKQTVSYQEGNILWKGKRYDELLFIPEDANAGVFELQDVTIGINFHWQRKENQQFQGGFRVIVEEGKLTGINVVPVERYLASVISSEMSATASLELLKAHAVISRSWLLAQSLTPARPQEEAEGELKWYEREAHTHFHVCADDHCQRYQGITRATTVWVEQAIAATRGEVLTFDGEICDARFSKCCGGVLEKFSTCWADKDYPYLMARRDDKEDASLPDLTRESEAEQWIRGTPASFCHTANPKVLTQVLNNYDQETTHFYRWEVTYTQAELAELIRQKSGIDLGAIVDLVPVKRGPSARLCQLKIVGTKASRIIGKELEIRRILSPSHLYSSAFVVDVEEGEAGVPGKFILKGAGWGHGVGLCQIGAAVMGEQGYLYHDILSHYYVGADVHRLYL